MKRDDVTPEIVRELLNYNPQTGVLTWKERDPKWFPDEGRSKAWNVRCANKQAFTCRDGRRKQYFTGRIFGIGFQAHRVAWAHYYGHWPKQQIDHVESANGEFSDNRISNLRDVSPSENQRNRLLLSNNNSGVCGVYWHKRDRSWRAQIAVNASVIYLGTFKSKAEAIATRRDAERRHGFHPNHGRTAKGGEG